MKSLPFTLIAVALELLYWRLSQAEVRSDVPGTIRHMMFASLVYIVSIVCVFRRKWLIPKVFLLVAAVAFRLTLASAQPTLSDDVYRYRWEGWVQHRGFNLYLVTPRDVQDHETLEQIPTPDARSGYGPAVSLIEWGAYELSALLTDDPHRQAFWMKLPAMAFEAATLVLLSRALPTDRLLIYAWCPAPIIEFWWSGHNDAIVVFCFMAALVLAGRKQWLGAHAALGAAIALKWWPAVLWPVLFAKTPNRWRTVWIAPAVLLAATAPYWTSEWRQYVQVARYMSGYVGGWRNNDSVYGLLLWLTGDQYSAKYAAFGLLACAVAWMIARRWSLAGAWLGTIVTMLLVSANCHPWYLTWMVPLAAFVPWTPLLVWQLLMPLSYLVLVNWHERGIWNGSRPDRWWIYGPFFVAIAIWLAAWIKSKSHRRKHDGGPEELTN